MLICYLIKLAFDSTKITWEDEGSLEEYLVNKGNFGLDYKVYGNLSLFTQYLKRGILGVPPNIDINKYFNLVGIEDTATKQMLTSRISDILLNLSPGSGVWKYLDPLEEVHDIDVSTIAGLPLKPLTMICYNRFTIAFVGFELDSDLANIIKSYINIELVSLERQYSYKHFDNIEELNSYITSEDYGRGDKPSICFGIYFEDKGGDKYSASLHYFNDFISHGVEDVPNGLKPVNEEMQQGPNMIDVQKYSDDGYVQFMNILEIICFKKSILMVI